jgi:hypothetical protein
MKFISKRQILIFLAALAIPVGYYLAWYIFKWLGIVWHTKYNLPGFLILGGSLPWSWLSLNYMTKLGTILGHKSRNIISIISVCLGFAINVTIAISLISKLFGFKRRST